MHSSLQQMFDIRDKVALVTGGRRGLGRAMCLGLARAGARVAVAAKGPKPSDLEKEILDMGAEFRYFQLDLLDRYARANLVDQVIDAFGDLHILVNNAGIQNKAPAIDYPINLWDADIELMLTCLFDLSQQAARVMIGNGGGKIIHIASISSYQGARQIIGYSSAKHAVVGLTKCMSNEWASHGINVNAIAPGVFDTDMAKSVTTDEKKSIELLGRVPAGRFGKPEDLVGPLLFLASDASRHVHGHVLVVDGGWLGR